MIIEIWKCKLLHIIETTYWNSILNRLRRKCHWLRYSLKRICCCFAMLFVFNGTMCAMKTVRRVRISCLWHYIHYLSISLYTWSELRTLFEAHVVFEWKQNTQNVCLIQRGQLCQALNTTTLKETLIKELIRQNIQYRSQ